MWLGAAALALFGVTADVAAGARADLAVGRAPLALGEPEQAALTGELVPALALRLETQRAANILRYYPRLFWRYPGGLTLTRPVVYHRIDFRSTYQASRSLELGGTLAVGAGELDYSGARLVFDPEQSSTVEEEVLKYGTATAGVDAELTITRDWAVQSSLEAERSGPVDLDEPGFDERPDFPLQDRVTLELEPRYQLTRNDTLSALLQEDFRHFSSGRSLWVSRAQLQHAHQWSRTDELRAIAGLVVGYWSEGSAGPSAEGDEGEKTRFMPVGSLSARGSVYQSRRIQLELSGTVGIDGLVDAIRATLEPRAGLSGSLSAILPPRWSAAIIASAYTAATDEPRSGPEGFASDETIASVTTPVRYLLQPGAVLEFGTRATVRGPHLEVSGDRVREKEYWAYVAFAYAWSTARDPSWLAF